MTIRFEIAGPGSAAEVDDLIARSYACLVAPAYPAAIRVDVLPAISRSQADLLASGTYWLVRDAEGRLLASGGWTPRAPGNAEAIPGLGHLRHVAVDPDRTGQGGGRALVDWLAREAARAGMTRLEALSTLNAEAFYAACGFRRLGAVEVQIGRAGGLPSVRMQARIGPEGISTDP